MKAGSKAAFKAGQSGQPGRPGAPEKLRQHIYPLFVSYPASFDGRFESITDWKN